mmetsp:Transcript_88558/g.222988  ORF Transcript_88558/g.222988 Transcript_88558/m.222988 type:complete len:399 (-) Transcript_88558:335-1531(-)
MRTELLRNLLAAALTLLPMLRLGCAFTHGPAIPKSSRDAVFFPRAISMQSKANPTVSLDDSNAAFPAVGLRSLGYAVAFLTLVSTRGSVKRGPSINKRVRAKVVCAAAGLPHVSTWEEVLEIGRFNKLHPVAPSAHVAPSAPLISLGEAMLPVRDRVTAEADREVAADVLSAQLIVGASISSNWTAVAPTRRPSPAFFVGGARRSKRRYQNEPKRGAAAAQKAARRAAGAQLRPESVVTLEPVVLSFDPSCLRVQIQSGLQISACTSLASARESKTPASANACASISGGHIEAVRSKSLDLMRGACIYVMNASSQLSISCLEPQARRRVQDASDCCCDPGSQDWLPLRLPPICWVVAWPHHIDVMQTIPAMQPPQMGSQQQTAVSLMKPVDTPSDSLQ